MSTLPIGMIIEGLVAVLLVVTIGYCWTLNRRLQRLRADEEILRATISELMTATEIAERAILGLKSTAAEADKTLGKRLTEAESLSQSLVKQIGEGEQVFVRISQIAEAARQASAHREAIQRSDEYVAQSGYVRDPEPVEYEQPTTRKRASRRSDDIRSAAAEATARLEQFRRRSEGAAA